MSAWEVSEGRGSECRQAYSSCIIRQGVAGHQGRKVIDRRAHVNPIYGYLVASDMFSRYRLKCKDKGYDQAARFVFLPLIKSDEESPAEGSAYNAQGGWLPLEERKHYFTLQVLQPGKDPLVMQLTGDHFITMTVVSGTHKWGPSDFLVSTFAMEIPEKGGMWERGMVQGSRSNVKGNCSW